MTSVTGIALGTVVIVLVSSHRVSSTSITCNSNGILRLQELVQTYSECLSLSPDSTVNWFLTPVSGQPIALGTCSRTFSCTITYDLVSSLNRSTTAVTLYFNATREMAGLLVCKEIFGSGTTTSANCTQDVVSPFDVDGVSVTTNQQDWLLTAAFSVRKVFSALGLYDVEILEYNAGVYSNHLSGLVHVKVETAYEVYNASTGLQYYRGNFTATWPVPQKSGKYFYTATLVPVRNLDVKFHPEDNGVMEIIEPAPPTTDCAFTYVPEVGSFNCQCTTKSLGTPAGRLQWLVGNEVIATGGYDVKNLQFPTSRVNHWHDEMLVTCQLDWVVKQHVFVTASVASSGGDDNIVGKSVGASVGVTLVVLAVAVGFFIFWTRRYHRKSSKEMQRDAPVNFSKWGLQGMAEQGNHRRVDRIENPSSMSQENHSYVEDPVESASSMSQDDRRRHTEGRTEHDHSEIGDPSDLCSAWWSQAT